MITIDTSLISSLGDIFIAKYDSKGQIVWARQAGSKYGDKSYGICLDGYSNILIAGVFCSGSTPYGNCYFGNLVVHSPRDYGAFLAKYDSSGDAIWAKSIGGPLGATAMGIRNRNSNIFVTGIFNGPYANFGNLRLNEIFTGYGGAFVAKYDSTGDVLWAKAIGATKGTYAFSPDADTNGNVYILGRMSSPITKFDSISLPGTSDIDNAFLAKYSPNGVIQWAKSITNDDFDYSGGSGLIVDKAGNSYTTGYFSYYCSVKQGDTVWSYGSSADVFVAKFDTDGNGLWATHGGPGRGYGIGQDGLGNLYVSGTAGGSSTLRFGRQTLTNPVVSDMFVAKLSLSTPSTDGIATVSVKIQEQFSVYPNPSNGSLTINSPKATFTNIKVTDQLGRQVLTHQYATGQHFSTIILPNFVPGLYFLTLQGANGTATEKFILQQ